MKLTCYAFNEFPPKLVAARPDRAWMDSFQDRHPYRCLPLSIANANGWEVLMPVPVDVEWNGGVRIEDLQVTALKPLPGGRPLDHFVRSNFSRGIVTFHTDYIFRTDGGWDLLATGPFNMPKYGVSPLTGVMESDWLPYPFTMNWQMLCPGRVRFEEDEPFCFIFPIPKQALVGCEPEIRRLDEEPELKRQHEAFRTSRDEFMARLRAGDETAIKEGWQRHYFVGRHPDGTRVGGHLHKLRLKEPVDRRSPLQLPAVAVVPGAETQSASPCDKRWEGSSLLNRIGRDQTAANRAGRSRLDRTTGLLTESYRTVQIGSSAEAQGYDFLYVENFFSSVECERLRQAFAGLRDRLFRDDHMDPFWNDRFVWLKDILERYPDAGRLMIERQRKSVQYVSRFYRLKQPIFSDLLQIVQWPTGKFMPPHADNANPDGSPHGMMHRQFSSVAYLNDDYEGGEFYFTALDIAIKPRRGSLLAFTGGFHHEHAVLRVHSGNVRLTIPSFYTFDATKADPLLRLENRDTPVTT